MPLKRKLPIVLLLPTFGLLASGCTTEEATINYPVPEKLCAMEVDTNLYTPLLPPGDDIEVESDYTVHDSGYYGFAGRCTLSVDDDKVIDLSSMLTSDDGAGPGIEGYFEWAHSPADPESGEPIPGSEYDVRVWSNYAIAFAPCPDASDNRGVIVTITTRGENRSTDHTETLKDLIEPYTEARVASMGPRVCNPSDGNT